MRIGSSGVASRPTTGSRLGIASTRRVERIHEYSSAASLLRVSRTLRAPAGRDLTCRNPPLETSPRTHPVGGTRSSVRLRGTQMKSNRLRCPCCLLPKKKKKYRAGAIRFLFLFWLYPERMDEEENSNRLYRSQQWNSYPSSS